MSGPVTLELAQEWWPLKQPMRIFGYTIRTIGVLVVAARRGERCGRGEAAGVYYRNETPQFMTAQIELVRDAIERSGDRQRLMELLPPGGARNAVDCALWELEAREQGRPVWALAGMDRPRALRTTWTLGADAPDAMAEAARRCSEARALKLKLTGDEEDLERVRQVRAARPDAWLAVDANQGLSLPAFLRLSPVLEQAQVQLLEQPFAVGQDPDLTGLRLPCPLAADESVLTQEDLANLPRAYQVVNIKLDKCGGLTAALSLLAAIRAEGRIPMVGNMSGTSLATAPAFIIAQGCGVIDLDGPLLLANDRQPSAAYRDGCVYCDEAVWGDAG